MSNQRWEGDLVIVGGGILGTFLAYHAVKSGHRVLLIERGTSAEGASVRNFGMIAPSGMPCGPWLDRANASAEIYRQLDDEIDGGLPLRKCGTQYIATSDLEATVVEQFASLAEEHGYRCELLDTRESVDLTPAIRPESCQWTLYFPDDMRVEPRELLRVLILHLQKHDNFNYLPSTTAVRRRR